MAIGQVISRENLDAGRVDFSDTPSNELRRVEIPQN
jgi:hypothetical protein